mgnify:CR=1 FL=1
MIRKAQGSFMKVGYSGSGLSNGNAASLDSSGNAVIADNTSTPSNECVGFIRHLESDHAIVQVDGELQLTSTVSGQEYWLSSLGNITNTVPTSGIIQKVGIGLPNNKLLVKIDRTTITL